MISELLGLGKKIYNTDNWRELHRLIVFLGRSLVHISSMTKLYRWYQADDIRREILANNPFAMEQATRAFFYAGSTFVERAALIRDHVSILQEKLQPKCAKKFGKLDSNYTIWHSSDEDIDWGAYISFSPGQRKEGLLAIDMLIGSEVIYQMMFWLAHDKNGELALWIGAMQGPNMANAKEVVKDVTKRSFRYRTKNLILYMTQAVARNFGVQHIYAVSNEGYYANNHVRRDRKLKTDFGAFWEEAGGHMTDDKRFYELPLVEHRKTMEEVPTRKRAVYRKRFAFQDDVDAQIAANLEKIMK